ncbi:MULTISPECIES: Lrp/AsnC family transcriptional regulator [unclassified Streptomyces]|uniref:Lrp/AsnC family transcriptional regulator n=1 Tax=unclassified Streptomyces TaxID=2593676 RepID=UPI002E303DC9|nr:Lrp/AsnC family transcriptional regulator [Streptomyces sp. NBC_01280]WSE19101.1 Lrp/AsnC family transcriptional regulator [Streptomyces sp. NBC_01397]
MTGIPGELQENISGGATVPDSRGTGGAAPFSELDLALVDALQAAPRAPWSRIGRALGVDATTAARRWERLRAGGLAWVSAYDSAKATTVAYVEVRCRPRAVESAGAALADMPWVFSVDETAGDFDLLASVVAADLPALGRSVHGLIGGLRGVRSTRTRLGITLYSEGGDWRMRAMEPSGDAELSAPRTSHPTPYSAHMHHRPPPEDQALLEALGRDGRLGYTDLGTATGMSEHTARRRLQRMVRDRDITFRCDLAHPLAGLSTVVLYRTAVPHTHLEATGNALARREEVRLAVSVSGSDNLLVMVWLRGLHAIDPFEAHLAERFPHLKVSDRTVFLHTRKRMGRLLDTTGRAVGHVPFSLPQV